MSGPLPDVGAGVVGVDTEPMHFAAVDDLFLADDRDVVFRNAGDDARVAAGARVVIDRHAPFVIPLVVGVIVIHRGGVQRQRVGRPLLVFCLLVGAVFGVFDVLVERRAP